MAGFDDREKAHEAKFAHDEALRFKAEARRNKLLGLWAAELLGHDNPDSYAGEVIAADFEEAGDDDVFRKVAGDFKAKGVSISDEDLRSKMIELMGQAIEEVSD